MENKFNILFAAQDAGGANALAPVIEYAASKYEVLVLAAKYAVDIFKKRGVKAIDCSGMDSYRTERLFLDFNPSVLIAGTSAGMSIEKDLILRAKEVSVPSLAVVESWGNYAIRFSSDGQVGDLKYLPDAVCVADSRMKRECVVAGVPGAQIVITGNPHLGEAALRIRPAKHPRGDIVFISQPFSSAPQERGFPFDEFSVLRDLFACPHINQETKVLVRLHPKDDLAAYQHFLDAEQPKGWRISLDKGGDLYSILGQARLVVGMNSLVLLEAAMAGSPVIRYQPGLLVSWDVFPRGILASWAETYDKQNFYKALDRGLAGGRQGVRMAALKSLCQPQEAIGKILKVAMAKVKSL